jgi:hypothetical protein
MGVSVRLLEKVHLKLSHHNHQDVGEELTIPLDSSAGLGRASLHETAKSVTGDLALYYATPSIAHMRQTNQKHIR